MKKGFTSKELLIALIIILSLGTLAYYIYTKTTSSSNKQELINQAILHIDELNARIIEAKSNGKTTIFQTYIPKKEGQTSTFNIENINLNRNDKYKGIIKVTYNKNKYEYKIAIQDGKYMLGTKKNPTEKKNINEKNITTYTKRIFEQ